jgi:hypothetical protein
LIADEFCALNQDRLDENEFLQSKTARQLQPTVRDGTAAAMIR